jgi:hypothetical protein
LRLLLELAVVFFALLTIYRRLIEPFIEGMKGKRKPYNRTDSGQKTKFNSASAKKNINSIDPKEIQDAEFEEIT